jgi:capsular polysaccharide biosynthesis protein
MTDPDQKVASLVNGDGNRHRRPTAFPEFAASAEQPGDVATGLVSLGYIWAAVKRRWRTVGALVAIGVLVGVGVYVKFPPAYKAQASVYITYSANENPTSAVQDNETIAASHSVASLAMKKMGVHESIGSFASSYTVAVVTDSVLQITAGAPTASQALAKANAVATEFLKFRAGEEETAAKLQIQQMEAGLTPDQNIVNHLNWEIWQTQQKPYSPAQQAQLKSFQTQERQANLNLTTLQQTVSQDKTGSETLPAVTGSVILDPGNLVARSKTKSIVAYALYGLFGGLAVSLAIVVIGAVTSDRLRRRDDIARALGAPVRLSVGNVRLGGLRGNSGIVEAARGTDVQRIVAYLRDTLPVGAGRSALAVVAADDPKVAALAVTSLALTCAANGRRVVLADLANGAPAAKLLDHGGPGIDQVTVRGAELTLAVPEAEEVLPQGPFNGGGAARRSRFTQEVRNACGSADVILTLATLDPGLGGEHLGTWADRAVAVVTAGASPWSRLQATGELVRIAGVTLTGAVLVGADKNDWSLGQAPDPDALLGINGIG